jgi:hypothetical protein
MATKKVPAAKNRAVGTVSFSLTLNDLKKISSDTSSFGGDSWQKIKWGKIDIGLEPIQARAGAATRAKRAKKA